MNAVDVLLNLAGLLLWLGWRTVRFPTAAPAATSISRVLKQAQPPRSHRWLFLAALLGLLALRVLLYWRVGSQVDWVPGLDLGAITLPFNSVSPGRMAGYSLLSFGQTLGFFYLCLLLLSVVNRGLPESDEWQRLVRAHLGWCERLPAALKLAGPALIVGLAWYWANPLLTQLGMAAVPLSNAHRWQQGLLVALGTVLAWKFLIVSALFLSVVNNYLYLGNWSFWTFVTVTARNLTGPLQRLPLRVGRIDFTPVLGLALVWLFYTYGEVGLNYAFVRLPL